MRALLVSIARRARGDHSSNSPAIRELNKNFSHGDLYGFKRVTVDSITEQRPNFIKALFSTTLALFIFWDVKHDYDCHAGVYWRGLGGKDFSAF